MGGDKLTAFWISFPRDPAFPMGLGVTAWSEADAYRLLEEQGYDFHRRAQEVALRVVRSAEDVDAAHVAPNAGPVVVRGVWYPCMNIGFGRP